MISILGVALLIFGVGGMVSSARKIYNTGTFPVWGLSISAALFIWGISRIRSVRQNEANAALAAKVNADVGFGMAAGV
jgi:hypothetical protein|tara:strand:- start:345 stop:578 length:234 start_codon:yes stop_codon:yes gene_type:complete